MRSIAVADDSKNRLFNRRLMLSVIAIALLTIMAVSLIGNADGSDADFDFEIDGLCYKELPNETDKVEVVKSKLSGAITIPSSVIDRDNIYSVTAIKLGAFNNTLVTSIVIPSSVTSIDGYAFSGCSALEYVTLDANITAINEHTFECCPSLTEISISASVNSIGNFAFNGCIELKKVFVHNPTSVPSTANSTFGTCGRLQEIYVPYTNYDDYCNSPYWSEMKDKP